MAVSPGQTDVLRDLRARSCAENGVFWAGDDMLAIFDPKLAQEINALNFSDLVLPDKLSDLLLGRTGKPIYWQQIREAWLDQMRRLGEIGEIEQLAARMGLLLDERAGSPRDLVWAAQEVISQALIPIVINGLDSARASLVLRDQNLKIRDNLVAGGPAAPWWRKARDLWAQAQAGWVVRRELVGRITGRRPRRLDLTDPIVDLLPELGIGRAVDAVTGVLTAIAGPPGEAAACLIYALVRYPEWAARLCRELATLPQTKLCAAPARAAPLTHAFIRETLRLWSPTPLVLRTVRKELEHNGVCLRPGQSYLLSPDILHHDPRFWKAPETFDPNRWLPGADREPGSGAYAPFGWAPRGCIGAGLGSTQLILFCQLLISRYQIDLTRPEALAMALPSMPVPQNLHGTLTRLKEAEVPAPTPA